MTKRTALIVILGVLFILLLTHFARPIKYWFRHIGVSLYTNSSSFFLNNKKSSLNTPTFPTNYTSTSPFGVLPNYADGTVFSAEERLAIAKSLGVSYMRTSETTGRALPYTEADLSRAGVRILMNIKKPDNVSLDAFKTDLAKKIADANPIVVVVENEENGTNFYDGSVAEYVAEITAATQVAHQAGVKVSDGGISSGPLRLATWNDYWSRGEYAKADAFAILAFRDSNIPRIAKFYTDLPSQVHPDLPILGHYPIQKDALDRTVAMINSFKAIPFDYVNFHWYQTTNGAMTEVVDYLKRVTGKEVITNEIGQYDTNPTVTTALMKESAGLRLPYIIWYSGDGGEGKAVGLTNKDGSLRATGIAFKQFIDDNY